MTKVSEPERSAARQSPSPTWARAAARRIGAALAPGGVSVRLWDGFEASTPRRLVHSTGGGTDRPLAVLTFESAAALRRCVLRPESGLADSYVDGGVTCEGDLLAALVAANRHAAGNDAEDVSGGAGKRGHVSFVGIRRLQARMQRILPAAAAANARSHYDLGNDFFASWLDPKMVYTCAYFETPATTLAEAQEAKLELICRKLGVGTDDRVVEVGAGWGALALHMAQRHGARVRAFNVSSAQTDYARARAKRLGLDDRVEFIEEDYREAVGKADVFVSVGMLETVGPRHYRELGRLIDRVLEPSGRGLLHSIGRRRPYPTDPWIARRIFPGSYYPSLSELLRVIEPNDLVVVDVENLRQHYSRTLACWLERFEAAAEETERRYDRRFVRMWRLYLTAAQAAFETHWLELFQVVFTKAGSDAPAWCRPGLPRKS